jgi:hypothetical protein
MGRLPIPVIFMRREPQQSSQYEAVMPSIGYGLQRDSGVFTDQVLTSLDRVMLVYA